MLSFPMYQVVLENIQPQSFNNSIIEMLQSWCPRPIKWPLGNNKSLRSRYDNESIHTKPLRTTKDLEQLHLSILFSTSFRRRKFLKHILLMKKKAVQMFS